MRKLLIIAAFLVAVPTFATDYTISTPGAPADALLEGMRVAVNGATCESVGLLPTCTQAQARARNADLNVYTTIADMLQRYVYRDLIIKAREIKVQWEASSLCRWWNLPSTSAAAKNGVCTTVGMSAGCDLCQ